MKHLNGVPSCHFRHWSNQFNWWVCEKIEIIPKDSQMFTYKCLTFLNFLTYSKICQNFSLITKKLWKFQVTVIEKGRLFFAFLEGLSKIAPKMAGIYCSFCPSAIIFPHSVQFELQFYNFGILLLSNSYRQSTLTVLAFVQKGLPQSIVRAKITMKIPKFFPVPCLFAPKVQKGIDTGKKSTRFWKQCILGWNYTWASKSTGKQKMILRACVRAVHQNHIIFKLKRQDADPCMTQ